VSFRTVAAAFTFSGNIRIFFPIESVRLSGTYLPLDRSPRTVGYTAIWQRVPLGPCSFISPFNLPLKMGDPKDETVFIGPLTSEKEAIRLESWIHRAREKGARL